MENAYSSLLIQTGKTKILCSASVGTKLPAWINPEESGWITAEYNMLPGSTKNRKERSTLKPDSRGIEIQRLIARSLRACVDLKKIKGYSIIIDCDVIQADGGTRTASINGGYIALNNAVSRMLKEKLIFENPLISRIGAISAGIVDGNAMLDLDYSEDSCAIADFNIVMNDRGNFIEIQGTGEKGDISRDMLNRILDYCQKGIYEIFDIQNKYIDN
jgi:ribonuclease PH